LRRGGRHFEDRNLQKITVARLCPETLYANKRSQARLKCGAFDRREKKNDWRKDFAKRTKRREAGPPGDKNRMIDREKNE